MSLRPPSSAGETPSSAQQIRLRQACDNCTASKVRCDKGQPACQRCLDSDILCGYSASRRYGKRSKRPKAAPHQIHPATPATVAGNTIHPMTIGETAQYPTPTFDDLTWTSISAGYNLNVAGEGFSREQPSLGRSNFDLESDQWMSQFDFPWANDIAPPPLPANRLSTEDNPSGTDVIGPNRDEKVEVKMEHAVECEAKAMNVLRSLQYSPTIAPRSGSNISATASGSSPATSANMETLLFTNKSALRDLTSIRKCRCAENPHVALLHITILHKVVFWYRVATTSRYHSETVELKPMKVQLGMLDLDEDDCASLHQAALLRELHKAVQVISDFEMHSTPDGNMPGPKSSPWSRLAVREVGDELRQIIQDTEGGRTKRF